MKTFKGIIILVCVMFFIGGASAGVTYKSHVDYDYGFYQVIGTSLKPANGTEPSVTNFTTVNYTNKTLTIDVGDTVLWINYDMKDWPLTIISEQGLWKERDSYLKYSYQKFNHTFTEPGTYTVYIKERDKFRQTILVNPTVTSIPTNVVETRKPVDTSVINTSVPTPEVTSVQISVTTTNTPTNATPVVNAVGTIMVVLLALYFLKKH